MIEALAVGLGAFTEHMRRAARLGLSGVAWPAHAAIVTPQSVETYEFGETDHHCAW
jgi:hypothetical protein